MPPDTPHFRSFAGAEAPRGQSPSIRTRTPSLEAGNSRFRLVRNGTSRFYAWGGVRSCVVPAARVETVPASTSKRATAGEAIASQRSAANSFQPVAPHDHFGSGANDRASADAREVPRQRLEANSQRHQNHLRISRLLIRFSKPTVHVVPLATVSDLPIGNGKPLGLIAGPCVIESEQHVHFLADRIREIAGGFIFKASFDKANRSSAASYRGPGLAEGLRILSGLRARGFSVLTDIHEPAQAGPVAEVCDVLQIPAFLCRQTDLLVEAGRTGRVVNIKKGQFVSPHDIRHAAEKASSTGNNRIWITERGTSFGYNNLVVDMRGLAIMREFGWPVIFDATHSVQLPGAAGAASGGQPQFIAPLARAAVAVGVDGLFVEVHEEPARALSDGANALRLDRLGPLWSQLREIGRLCGTLTKDHFQGSC